VEMCTWLYLSQSGSRNGCDRDKVEAAARHGHAKPDSPGGAREGLQLYVYLSNDVNL